MPRQCNYLYGVVPANGSRRFGPIGVDGGDVRAIPDGDLAMIASPAEAVCFSELAPEKALHYLAEHQRVLERVMVDSPVIPLKFGTLADDDRQIVGVLRSGCTQFSRALNRFAGKVEVDLVASWADLQAVLAEIGESPAVVSMKTEIAAETEPTMEQRIRLGRLVKKLLDELRERVTGRLFVALRTTWRDIAVNPTRDDSMILNAAVLIDRSEEAEFDRTIEQLNRSYEDRLNFRCVGPLPPYSFATAEVKTTSAEELDAARQALGLSEQASLAEIKAAHRRLLREYHPDTNPGADAAEKVKEVSAAYELLEQYAMNFKHALNAAANAGAAIVEIRTLAELREELAAQAA